VFIFGIWMMGSQEWFFLKRVCDPLYLPLYQLEGCFLEG